VTQFPQQGYYDPTMMNQPMMGEPPRRSGLAITALVFSILGIIPCCGAILAPVGVLLGLIGLVAIKPPVRGKGMALSAIIVGVIFASIQIAGGVWGYRKFVQPIMEGPRTALQEGFAGNIAGFKSRFTGDGASVPDAEAAAFIEQLRSRYGEFQGIREGSRGTSRQPQMGDAEIPVPFLFDFSKETGVRGEAVFVFATQPPNQQLVLKWGSIHIVDPVNGDLVYPASAAQPSMSPASSPSRAGRPPRPRPGAPGNPPATSPADDPSITTSPDG